MSNDCMYKHILVGIDLTDETKQVLEKAVHIAKCCQAKISVAHVLEPVAFAYGGDLPLDIADIQEHQIQKATEELKQHLSEIDFPITQEHVLVGQPADELHYLAEQQEVDLIVVGSHGRKGLALLLGSTPNSVLHGASCDVLAIRVRT